jgi:hypothetical protein
VDEPFMLATLAHAATPTAWLDAMVERVRTTAKANHDNFSAHAVWISASDDPEATVLRLPDTPARSAI